MLMKCWISVCLSLVLAADQKLPEFDGSDNKFEIEASESQLKRELLELVDQKADHDLADIAKRARKQYLMYHILQKNGLEEGEIADIVLDQDKLQAHVDLLIADGKKGKKAGLLRGKNWYVAGGAGLLALLGLLAAAVNPNLVVGGLTGGEYTVDNLLQHGSKNIANNVFHFKEVSLKAVNSANGYLLRGTKEVSKFAGSASDSALRMASVAWDKTKGGFVWTKDASLHLLDRGVKATVETFSATKRGLIHGAKVGSDAASTTLKAVSDTVCKSAHCVAKVTKQLADKVAELAKNLFSKERIDNSK